MTSWSVTDASEFFRLLPPLLAAAAAAAAANRALLAAFMLLVLIFLERGGSKPAEYGPSDGDASSLADIPVLLFTVESESLRALAI